MHDVLRHIKRSLGSDTFGGEDGGLRDVELQTSICLEDGLELSQNLLRHAQFGLNVPIVGVFYRSSLLELS